MTRDEWYESVEFVKVRALNNDTHAVLHALQRCYDTLRVALESKGPILHDRVHLYERQLALMSSEARRLIGYVGDVTRLLEPKLSDFPDFAQGGATCGTESKPSADGTGSISSGQ